MDKGIELATEISEKIAELPEVKEYLRLKKIIDEDEEIKNLQKEIVSLQHKGEKAKADEFLKKMNAMPIVINFEQIRGQLADTLKVISNILE